MSRSAACLLLVSRTAGYWTASEVAARATPKPTLYPDPEPTEYYSTSFEEEEPKTVMAAQRSPMMWLHFHKCAGSTICDLARANNETTPSANNCNSRRDSCSGPYDDWLSEPHQKTCAERASKVTDPPGTSESYVANDYTFLGLERWMDDEMCEGLLYGTMIRDPMSRIKSNTLYAWENGMSASTEDIMLLTKPGTGNRGCVLGSWETQPEKQGTNMTWKACSFGYCDAIERSVAAYDNFYTRSLAGGSAFKLPAGEVTRAHLDTAKDRLGRFNVVMLLENYTTDVVQLASSRGWTSTVATANPTKNAQWLVDKGCIKQACFTDEQLQTLTERNWLDIELYEYARSLAATRTAAALQLQTKANIMADTSNGTLAPDESNTSSSALDPVLANAGPPNYGLAFVHIPKNAGTTIEDMGHAHGFEWGKFHPGLSAINYEMYPKQGERVCNVWHLPPAMFVHEGRRNPYEGNHTFCVVRHPYTRLMSEALFARMIHGAKLSDYCYPEEINELMSKHLDIVEPFLLNYSNWDGTLRYGNVGAEADCHWLPQHAYTHGPGVAPCDTVMVSENLHDGWDYLMEKINPAGRIGSNELDLFRETVKYGQGLEACHMEVGALNETIRERIATLYYMDMSTYGYSPEMAAADAEMKQTWFQTSEDVPIHQVHQVNERDIVGP